MHLAADRGSAGGDPFDAGDLGRHHGHVRGRDERVAPARHIGSGRGDGDVALPEEDPRRRLDLEVAQRLPLPAGELGDVVLGRADVVDDLAGQAGDDRVDLVGAEPERRGAPPVETLGVLPHRRVAAGPDVLDHPGDGLPDHTVRTVRGGTGRRFQDVAHLGSLVVEGS